MHGRNKKLKNQQKVITQTFQATNHVKGAEFKVEPVEDVTYFTNSTTPVKPGEASQVF